MMLWVGILGCLYSPVRQALELLWWKSSLIEKRHAGASTPIGGISAAVVHGQVLTVVSDHKRRPMFWRFLIRTGTAKLRFLSETPVRVGGPYDLEGMDRLGERLFVSDEGVWSASGGLLKPPQILEFSPRGTRAYPAPRVFQPGPKHGVNRNRSLESLAVDSEGKGLFLMNEDELKQDEGRNHVRLVWMEIDRPSNTREWIYPLDEWDRFNGVSDILTVDSKTLWVLERGGKPGGPTGFISHARIYEVALDRGVTLTKRLLVDFVDRPEHLAPGELDNLEALTWGPRRETLWVLSDDNFRSQQQNQVYVFKVVGEKN
jgi:hypothetical protein